MTVGHLPKDQHQGALAALWASKLEAAAGVAAADASGGFADLFGCKDEAEVLNVKKAAFLAVKVRRRLGDDVQVWRLAVWLGGLRLEQAAGVHAAGVHAAACSRRR